MPYSKRIIYLHGLMSDSSGIKATLLRGYFPGILTPDFTGSLDDRMALLEGLLGSTTGWKIIGSSFGGLMGALFACRNPRQVDMLVLLAPALIWPDFANDLPQPIDLPVVVYHGLRDEYVPIEIVRGLAEQTFRNLTFNEVDDDHGLYSTVHSIDWLELLA